PPPTQQDPARLWPVHVPRGVGGRLAPPERWQKRVVARGAYRVRLGDTLATVAERLRGAPEELAALNRLDPDARLIPGSALLVPATFGVALGASERLPPRDDAESVVVLPPARFSYVDRERVFYRV